LREQTAPYTRLVAGGAPNGLSIRATPNNGTGENDWFAVTTAADGSTWAAGWYIDLGVRHRADRERRRF
jgi:hypothetical protein